jgi:hypothetical protein
VSGPPSLPILPTISLRGKGVNGQVKVRQSSKDRLEKLLINIIVGITWFIIIISFYAALNSYRSIKEASKQQADLRIKMAEIDQRMGRLIDQTGTK